MTQTLSPESVETIQRPTGMDSQSTSPQRAQSADASAGHDLHAAPPRAGHRNKTQSGYVGVDVGTRSIKMIRLVKRRGVLQVAESTALDLLPNGPPSQRPGRMIAAAVKAFGGRRVPLACVLPKTFYAEDAVDCAELAGRTPEQVVKEHLQRRSPIHPSELTVDYWPLATPDATVTRWQVVAIQNRVVNDFVKECQSTGWRVKCIDSIPYTAARCVQLHFGAHQAEPVGVLDWGHSSAKLTVVSQGVPVLSRLFRHVGWIDATNLLAERLGITPIDADALLERYADTSATFDSAFDQAMLRSINEMLIAFRKGFEKEIERTLEYIGMKLRLRRLDRMIVTGGGAPFHQFIKDLAGERIGETMSFFPHECSLSGLDPQSIGIFANAISLSSLAFEGPSA